jgi:hypothetical protein
LVSALIELSKAKVKLPQFIGVVFLCVGISSVSFAQQKDTGKSPAPSKPKMVFLGEFDAGQPNAGIFKLFDPTDEVLCYILMPTSAIKKQVEVGVWAYEGNSLGSISCVKVTIPRSDVIKR